MTAESHYIIHRSSHIHYLRMGTGSEWLFCFHGYGENAASFRLLEPLLGKRFTLIAIDFPFHGLTEWNEGFLFTPEELLAIIDQIRPKEKRIHLLGYSMGGRVAMQLLQLIPESIHQLALIAPDGLHNNKWQWIATRTSVGNRFFHYFMAHPSVPLALINAGAAIGLYSRSLHKFVHYYLDDRAQRITLYQRWTTMRRFRPDKDLLKSLIRKHKIRVRMLFGKHDHVILTKHGIVFSKNTDGRVQVKEIKAGHLLLKEKHLRVVVGLLED